MIWYFKLSDKSDNYCVYSFSSNNPEDPDGYLIHWLSDDMSLLYDKNWIERGKKYPHKAIVEVFNAVVVSEGFPEKQSYLAPDINVAIRQYRTDFNRICQRLLSVCNAEAGIESSTEWQFAPKEAIRHFLDYYQELDQQLRLSAQLIIDHRDNSSCKEDYEQCSDLRKHPVLARIMDAYESISRLINYRQRQLSELRQSMSSPFARPSFMGKKRDPALDSYREFIAHSPAEGSLTAAVDETNGFLDHYQYEIETKDDDVNYTVLSPKAVTHDAYELINILMYTDPERKFVDRIVSESSGLINETTKDGFRVSRGTDITARLESDDVKIRDNLETQTWNGRILHFDFQFYVPADYSRRQIAFVCYIEANGIPVTRLNFLTRIAETSSPAALPAKVTKSDYHKAFISYSRIDEQRMLSRVLGIRDLVPDMKFWLDKQSLDAGDLWREEIRKAILLSDILLLFWSVPASKSAEVEKEWRFGLEEKGLTFIAPVPLDPPNLCPPPEILSSLNFTVRAFSKNEIIEKLSFFNSDNIVLL